MTPARAIRLKCLECVGSAPDVRKCGGDDLHNGGTGKDGKCLLYKYRLGRGAGKPSIKLIRKFCVWCMGGNPNYVEDCTDEKCPFFEFRFGKRPKHKSNRLRNDFST